MCPNFGGFRYSPPLCRKYFLPKLSEDWGMTKQQIVKLIVCTIETVVFSMLVITSTAHFYWYVLASAIPSVCSLLSTRCQIEREREQQYTFQGTVITLAKFHLSIHFGHPYHCFKPLFCLPYSASSLKGHYLLQPLPLSPNQFSNSFFLTSFQLLNLLFLQLNFILYLIIYAWTTSNIVCSFKPESAHQHNVFRVCKSPHQHSSN